jgi:hypothetical protein
MILSFVESDRQEVLIEHCHDMAAEEQVKGLFLLACDGNDYDPSWLSPKLQDIDLPLFGGTFPGIIHGRARHEKGAMILGLSEAPAVCSIPGLSLQEQDFETAIGQFFPNAGDTQTLIVLVDGLARRISGLIEGLFNHFGLEFNYIGGGAGSLSMVQKPCLFTNAGVVQDHAVLALLAAESGVGVRHGWEPLAGPFQVTESRHNVVVSIDFQPAFEIYRRSVEPHLGREVTAENFFEMAKNHPLGLAKLGAEKLVRDPAALTPDGGIQCVGEVPEGSYFHILTGSTASLVDAARRAMETACAEYPGTPDDKPTFFFDCISRVLYLGDHFQQEIDAVQRPGAPLVGALTIGEIGCSGRDYLEFYNKTSVAGILDV